MDLKFVQIEKQDLLWTLTIHRPEALNALNAAVLADLSSALKMVQEAFPKDVRGVILTGFGPKSFVAGADIAEMVGISADQGKLFSQNGQKIFRQIESLPVPVIAAVNGFALGGGLELALACDFIYASDQARLGLPEVSLGLVPGFGGTVRLSRVVGLNRAREIILGGEMIKADEAFAMGLVNKIFPATDLIAAARKTLLTMSERAPLAVKTAKALILSTFDQDMETALATEAKMFGELFKTKDTLEGTKAFVEKRKSQFQGE